MTELHEHDADEVVDVVVVGAGLAGMTAAQELQRSGQTVRVLEAADHAGGRVIGESIGDGETIEVGGQWVGPTQLSILGLIERLGLQTYRTRVAGNHVYYRNGVVSHYDATNGPIPPESEKAVAEIYNLLQEIDRLAKEVRPDRPWESERALEWDNTTFQEWITSIASEDAARVIAEYVTRGTNTCEPSELPLLHMLSYVAAAGDDNTPGSLGRVVITENGASQWRVVGGSQRVPEGLARELGDTIVLSSPARSITQDEQGVVVRTEDKTYRAKRVIVAMAPKASAAITFEPGLPQIRTELVERLQRGAQIKLSVVYDKPFWNEKGLSGYVLSDSGPVQNVWDNTPASGGPGVLVCFIKGEAARALDTEDDAAVRKIAVDNLVTYFGEDAANPRQIVMKRWHNDPLIQGCPGSLPVPGLLTTHGRALRESVGRVHWAGTETATYWQGFMDGAVASGIATAAQVVQALAEETSSN